MKDLNKRIRSLVDTFSELYGKQPDAIVRAPGRVNLIGEHTDYNGGYVLPVAIDRDILLAFSRSTEPVVCIYSVDLNRTVEFSLGNIGYDTDNRWSNYLRGVASILINQGYELTGADLVVHGNIPMATGLSSSAAFEIASAMAFQYIGGFDIPDSQIAQLCQTAENDFVGVNCGIMDQFISMLGTKDHALLIDCQSLEYDSVPLPANTRVLVSNSLKSRDLVDSEYNDRRDQCKLAVSLLRHHISGITSLRELTVGQYKKYIKALPPTARRRVEHVVHENSRVLKGVDALRKGDMARFGALMNESHKSLRDLYEVSCRELDVLVESAQRIPGVYGSRMTGAGFGGCTVSLVADSAVKEFIAGVTDEYSARIGMQPEIYVCSPANGAEIIFLD